MGFAGKPTRRVGRPVGEGMYEARDEELAVMLYRHIEPYVFRLLSEAGFQVIYDAEFLVSREHKSYFRAVVTKR